jgi:hypothetical protein
MGGRARTGFLPSRDGFAFTNSWPNEPAIGIPTPFGPIGIGNAARGLCGGMVFGALDYWHAGTQPPADRPASRSAAFRFIVRRLVQSWHIPVGVARYYYWMNLPDADTPLRLAGLIGPRRRGLQSRSITRQWPRIRAQLEAGQPAALGVVTVASANPLLLGHNHQVLAYAYHVEGTEVTLQVYDPNSGPADDVCIRFDAASAGAAGFAHTIDVSGPVRGFFRTAYSPARPPGIVRAAGSSEASGSARP